MSITVDNTGVTAVSSYAAGNCSMGSDAGIVIGVSGDVELK
jgi:hypothetical protein